MPRRSIGASMYFMEMLPRIAENNKVKRKTGRKTIFCANGKLKSK
jgi:hypothetical protein